MRLILVLFVAVAVSSLPAKEEETLKLVHVFFRHGSRTPELKHAYPADPYTSETFWPMGYGQLTNKGKRMSFKLGQLLRDRYDTFLGDIYTPDVVKGTSTDYDRTKMTLLQVLAGLFPPAPSQMWNTSIPWMPIPIYYEKDSTDYWLRRPIHYCPAYVKALEEVLHYPDVLSANKAYASVYKHVQDNTKLPINNRLEAFNVYQTLNAEDTMNLTLPKWTESVYPEPLHEISGMQCNYENYNQVLKRLNGGRMLGKIIRHMLDKSTGDLSPPGRKIYLYSGHENNVINILAALNVFSPHVPKYTSAAIVELHYLKEISGYGVKVLYLKDAYSEPEVKKLDGCDEVCPLNTFVNITEPHVPVNYTAECQSNVNLD